MSKSTPPGSAVPAALGKGVQTFIQAPVTRVPLKSATYTTATNDPLISSRENDVLFAQQPFQDPLRSNALSSTLDAQPDPLSLLHSASVDKDASSSQKAGRSASTLTSVKSPRSGVQTNQQETLKGSDQRQEKRDKFTKFFLDDPPAVSKKLSSNSVSQDESGVISLITTKQWSEALALCSVCLKRFTAPDLVCRVRSYKVMALIHLKRFKEAKLEIETLGPLFSADKSFQSISNKYTERKGNFIPFTLHLFGAEISRFFYAESTGQSVDELVHLLNSIENEIKSDSEESKNEQTNENQGLEIGEEPTAHSLSLSRMCSLVSRYRTILMRLADCFISMGDFDTAKAFVNLVSQHHCCELHDSTVAVAVWNYLGRMELQLGNNDKASAYFERIEKWADVQELREPEEVINLFGGFTQPSILAQTCRALMLVAYGKFEEAFNLFSELTKKAPDYFVLNNNLAVCAIYLNKLTDAISALEYVVRSDPHINMKMEVVTNLCLLYDRCYSSKRSAEKKNLLKKIAETYGTEDVLLRLEELC